MGGVQFSTFNLLQELKKHPEIQPKLFLPKLGPFSQLCDNSNLPYSVYPSFPVVSSSFSFFNDHIRIPNPFAWIYNFIQIINNSISIRGILKQQESGIVLSKGLHSHFISIIANRKLSHKLVWHLQDLISHRFGGLLRYIMNYCATIGTSYIICDGSSIFESLTIENKNKSKTVLNGIDVVKFNRSQKLRKLGRNEFNIPQDAFVIGHVGRITPWKGQLKLVDAFIEYSDLNKNAFLFLVGAPTFGSDTYLNEIKHKINKHKLENKIILPGYRTDLNMMYSIMDYFIYPSLEKDTSPLALLSALSSGLPVSMSSIECLKEITEKLPEVSTFNPKEKNEIKHLFSIYEKKQKQVETANLIKMKFNFHFSLENHVKTMIEVFNTI